MEQLDPPDPLVWDERRLWFERRQAEASVDGAGKLSEQATALLIDVQACFCAGAWIAVVILAATVVDNQVEASKQRRAAPAEELRWLRALRNRLVHEDRTAPVLTIEAQWSERREWERSAKRAVDLVFAVFYPRGRAVDSASVRSQRRPE
ncbi:hypothetical protein [Algihabitans albus]|uniref:hypothetical protein n=1 Tax=Algihabitans albus TaxID=2164067 RepID=UPI000E5D72B2|nr:hypothetical protein [Algihabitans albus]